MNRKVGIILAIAAFSTIITLSGCSLIGLGVGSIIDASKPGTYTPVNQDSTLKPGPEIKVITTKGDTVVGDYLGLDYQTPTVYYEEQYANAQEENKDTCPLPDLHQDITIETSGLWEGEFCGFCRLKRGDMYLLVRPTDNPVPAYLDMANVSRIIDRQGVVSDGIIVRELLDHDQIPLVSNMMIRVEHQTIYVPTDEIDKIMLNEKGHKAATIGFVLGLTVDVAAIITWAVIANQFRHFYY